MYAHAGAEHDLARDIRRLRHLHHLAKHQLFNQRRVDAAARHQLTDRHFTEIHRRHAVIGGRLFGERGA